MQYDDGLKMWETLGGHGTRFFKPGEGQEPKGATGPKNGAHAKAAKAEAAAAEANIRGGAKAAGGSGSPGRGRQQPPTGAAEGESKWWTWEERQRLADAVARFKPQCVSAVTCPRLTEIPSMGL